MKAAQNLLRLLVVIGGLFLLWTPGARLAQTYQPCYEYALTGAIPCDTQQQSTCAYAPCETDYAVYSAVAPNGNYVLQEQYGCLVTCCVIEPDVSVPVGYSKCCYEPGYGCSSSTNCCSPYVCINAVCSYCLNPGQTCSNTSQCCSGNFCNSQSECQQCLNPPSSCSSASQCCSGLCYESKCWTYLPNGAPCTQNSQCSSDTCSKGVCVPACIPSGGSCSSGTCCSGLFCYNNVCSSCVPNGGPCSAGPCCSSFCNNGTCSGGY